MIAFRCRPCLDVLFDPTQEIRAAPICPSISTNKYFSMPIKVLQSVCFGVSSALNPFITSTIPSALIKNLCVLSKGASTKNRQKDHRNPL